MYTREAAKPCNVRLRRDRTGQGEEPHTHTHTKPYIYISLDICTDFLCNISKPYLRRTKSPERFWFGFIVQQMVRNQTGCI